ncbi:2-amino-4-hydroxy-6-hydroxymethyldihydropteridine diphosphokinase [methane-oxidizing endosymbiont of Gigantopelta aegis]|uniref:2-amino-4-hydroxy-6- hydroxymethyldihydropteridine diphosphokinase n=1 Tax=methane-oxidizing endosymbiont of Gigantopelta aegis TaxID=2794938 RepID=UPI0018DEAD4D|nr:2-amino-4-hydroxy-6-hydroxymethyldihydropteridine diphosphokinase [methane-oxidizing endosymbiont of Gigantopelta aegis]
MKAQAEIEVYIGLGSNLEQPEAQIKSARKEIAALPQVAECAFSSLYRSAPMGPQDQPDYVNAVMKITTDLSPMALLHALQEIENRHGRVRARRWGERTLDLDILLYGDQHIVQPDLIIPHIGIAERAFVLYPLEEIAGSDLVIPGQGTLAQLLAACPLNGLCRLPA